jgi:hypothetical protein
VQAYCSTPLEKSQGELQVCFTPHPDRRFEQEVTSCQSLKSPNRDSFGTNLELPLGSPGTKKPFGCGPRGVVQNILYGGRWWLPPNPGHGESSESRVARGLS